MFAILRFTNLRIDAFLTCQHGSRSSKCSKFRRVPSPAPLLSALQRPPFVGRAVNGFHVSAGPNVGPRIGFMRLDEQFCPVYSATCSGGVGVRVLSRVGVRAKPK